MIVQECRKFVVPDRAMVEMPFPAVISKRSEKSRCSRRAKVAMAPPLSKRSEKSRVSEDAFLGADDGCMRSLPLVEMTAGEGREGRGRSK